MLNIEKSVKVLEGCDSSNLPIEVMQSTQPILLKGLVKDWPVVSAGQHSKEKAIEYLLQFYDSKPVVAFLAAPESEGRLFYNEDMSGFNFKAVRGKLDEILAELLKYVGSESHALGDAKVPICYVGSTNIDHWFPAFRQHNDLALEAYDPLASIWLGNQSKIAAHYDFPSNIACCVAGHRRFTLFPPEQLGNLYVGPIDFTPAGQAISLVDFDHPDYEKYPKFRDAIKAAQVAELEPGDALYLPSMWWHHVESFDAFNILVNYWWRSTPEYTGAPSDALLHALLAFKSLPEEQRVIWQNMLNFYVFDSDEESVAHIPKARRGVLGPLNEKLAQSIRQQLSNNLKD